MRVCEGPEKEPTKELPTAVHQVREAHDTPKSVDDTVPRLGLPTSDHAFPFQRSINVRV